MGFMMTDDRVCIKVQYTFIQLFQGFIQLQSGLSSDKRCNTHITASMSLTLDSVSSQLTSRRFSLQMSTFLTILFGFVTRSKNLEGSEKYFVLVIFSRCANFPQRLFNMILAIALIHLFFSTFSNLIPLASK